MTSRCRCGEVELVATGCPIVSTVCYCVDCQTGSRQIEDLPGAGPVREADGGVAYILYRRDRLRCSRGAALLKAYKLKPSSVTNRMVATCCNSAMIVTFDKGPFWVSAYRGRFQGDLPRLDMRICAKSRAGGLAVPTDAPSFPGYPAALMARLLMSGLAMLVRR